MYTIVGSIVDRMYQVEGLLLLPKTKQTMEQGLKVTPVISTDAVTLAKEGQIYGMTTSCNTLILDKSVWNRKSLKRNNIAVSPYLDDYLKTLSCFHVNDVVAPAAVQLMKPSSVTGQISKPIAISLNYLMQGSGKVVADFSFYSPLELTKTDKETIKNELKKMFSCLGKQDAAFGKISYSNYFTLTLRFDVDTVSFMRGMDFLQYYGICVSTAMFYTYDMSKSSDKLMPLEQTVYHRLMTYFSSLRGKEVAI